MKLLGLLRHVLRVMRLRWLDAQVAHAADRYVNSEMHETMAAARVDEVCALAGRRAALRARMAQRRMSRTDSAADRGSAGSSVSA